MIQSNRQEEISAKKSERVKNSFALINQQRKTAVSRGSYQHMLHKHQT